MVQSGSRYVLAYLLWAVSVVLAIMALLTWRSSAMIILGITPWDRYLEHTLNQFGFLFLAILGLCVIVFTEYYYRTGVEKNRLFVRFFGVTFVELLFILAAHLARAIGIMILALPSDDIWPVLGAEAVLSIGAFVLWQRARAAYVPPEV
ncbi:MAG TPA: hypothetical protein P5121_10210 [Caldilineaceae bacterium]|nr:hypothetical protein [Caldilineaceae bacterium]